MYLDLELCIQFQQNKSISIQHCNDYVHGSAQNPGVTFYLLPISLFPRISLFWLHHAVLWRSRALKALLTPGEKIGCTKSIKPAEICFILVKHQTSSSKITLAISINLLYNLSRSKGSGQWTWRCMWRPPNALSRQRKRRFCHSELRT